MTDDVKKFLETLHPTKGFRDFRGISTDKKTHRQFSFPTNDYKKADEFITAKFNIGLNIFVGVAIRSNSHSGTLKDCVELHALFADLDFKSTDEARTRQRLAEFPLPPSISVMSGGGLQPYWLMDPPVLFKDADPAYVKAVLRALAVKIGADLGAATPERILRIPGTLNHKYNPPRDVVIEVWQPERRYTLRQVLDVIGEVKVGQVNGHKHEEDHELKGAIAKLGLEDKVKLAKEWLKKQAPAVQGEGGDQHTFGVACSLLIGHDLSKEAALNLMQEWNKTCRPPWDLEGLKEKIRNADNYGDKSARGNKLYVGNRRGRLTPASAIAIKPIHWVWEGRIASGTLALLAGREGIGKSLFAYQTVADLTNGRLKGRYFGTSKNVIIVATEDDWERVIVPRLMAAGADLNRVYRFDIDTTQGEEVFMKLPQDNKELRRAIQDLDAAMVLLDPLISRLDSKLDSHKDAEVRMGLEPIAKLAAECDCVILGIIHLNKSSTTDPLTAIMGSRAFVAVARATLFVSVDIEDPTLRMVSVPKNNYGDSNLPSLLFTIKNYFVAKTDDGDVYTGKLEWTGETTRTLETEMEAGSSEDRGAIIEASQWMTDYLTVQGGFKDSIEIKKAGKKEGFSVTTLGRARKRIGIVSVTRGTYPKTTIWCLPGHLPPEVPVDANEPEFVKDQMEF